MIVAFEELHWAVRLALVVFAITYFLAPIGIWQILGRMQTQNDRIIDLLADIKMGRRDL